MTSALLANRTDRRITWLSYALGLAHLGFGLTKVLALPQMVDSFHRWQLPLWMMYFVGAAQLLGGVGFFIRNFRLPASFAMGLVMVGATVTVLATAHSRGSALLTLLLAMLCFFVAGYRLQQLARELMAKESVSHSAR